MFESLVRDVASQFGMGGTQAQSLLGWLLKLVFDKNAGGFSGFISKFQQAGLGNLTSSWLGNGQGEAIQPDAVNRVLGSDAISKIASKIGIPANTASGALATMLPKVIGGLTPNGQIPTSIPSSLTHLLGGVGAGAAGAAAATTAAAATATRAVERTASSGLGFLKWLIPLLIVIGLIAWLWPRGHNVAENAAATANAAASATAETATNAANATGNAVANAASAAGAAAGSLADKAAAAFAALKPGYTATDLVGALNTMTVNFETGSANIDPGSDAILDSAATAIKAAPTGTRIEIGGYTDNTGDADANLKLSQDRADSVRNYLTSKGVDGNMLVAKGYGEANATATNATAEGRAENRRMEFKVLN